MIRAGDRFVPCDSLGDEIEADGPADGGGLVPAHTSRGVTLTVSQSLLLDPLKWCLIAPAARNVRGKCDVGRGPCACGAFHSGIAPDDGDGSGQPELAKREPSERARVTSTALVCLICGVFANVHITELLTGRAREVHYCEEHAPLPLRADHVVPSLAMVRKAAKWRPSLVPAGTDEAIARAMQAGIDAGHEEGDWQKREARVFYDATLRHLLDCVADLAALDDVSGLAHLDHALASLAILRNLAAR